MVKELLHVWINKAKSKDFSVFIVFYFLLKECS
jgi:hypothetical protein